MVTHHIAVGVDATVAARSALLWAADTAALHATGLLVVHVVPPVAELPATPGQTPAEVAWKGVSDGERLLRRCASTASDAQPKIPVSTALRHGDPISSLVRVSEDVDVVVIGRARHGAADGILGSLGHRLAVRAHCAVAVVPASGTADASISRIVVGVSAGHAAHLALEAAFVEAELRGASVLAVHSSDPEAADTPGPAHHSDSARDRIDSWIADAQAIHPGVPVELAVGPGAPEDRLLAVGAAGSMVVLGCHHTSDLRNTRLGPVPTAVLPYAACPVLLVGQSRAVSRPNAAA